ncbi:MAG: 50S ribosomal protein L22 [Planctomycetota bacterium]|jgi:large subunit ribosomal protein L22
MAYRAIHRYARIAPRKARLVADMIRGMKIEEAMNSLEFSKRRAAWYFKAVLRSALANAQEEDVDVHGLYVSESRVDEGPTMKRWQPKDRGRAHPIAKRTSHLYVSLDER